MTISNSDIALTRHQAAAALKLCLSSIDALIKTGELPSTLFGRKRLISAEGARAWLRQRTETQAGHPDTCERS